MYTYYRAPNYYNAAGYYSTVFLVVYYDGYGYNFYYGDYGYYEYSVNEKESSGGGIIGTLIAVAFIIGIIYLYLKIKAKLLGQEEQEEPDSDYERSTLPQHTFNQQPQYEMVNQTSTTTT